MRLEKYQACGNDFIIINEYHHDFNSLAKKLCNRHYSIGADGLIYIDEESLLIRFFNSDGSEALLCGNGLRCAGLYLFNKGIFLDYLQVCTLKQTYQLILENNNPYIVKIIFPLIKNKIEEKIINVNEQSYNFMKIDVGNKHAITIIDDMNIDEKLAEAISKKLSKYNIDFVRVINRRKIQVKTYEKGVGFTLSCGSGSFASVLCLYQKQLIDEIVDIDINNHFLQINLFTNSLSGDVERVFECEI